MSGSDAWVAAAPGSDAGIAAPGSDAGIAAPGSDTGIAAPGSYAGIAELDAVIKAQTAEIEELRARVKWSQGPEP